MSILTRPLSSGFLACAVLLATPSACWSQAANPTPIAGSALESALPATNTVVDGRWEVTLEGRIGFPTGHLQSVDRPRLGTRFSFNDLGIDVSEALEASAAFSFTPRDAVRATFLYYFLRGSSTQRVTTGYNGLPCGSDASGPHVRR